MTYSFSVGDIKSLKSLSVFFKTNGDFFFYQNVNNYKSSFFTMDNSTRFVTKYLGVSIFVGAPKCQFLQHLTDKVKLKLAS